jgi:hypothetical protein
MSATGAHPFTGPFPPPLSRRPLPQLLRRVALRAPCPQQARCHAFARACPLSALASGPAVHGLARDRGSPRHLLGYQGPPHRCHCLRTVGTALSSRARPYLHLKQLYGAARPASVMVGENATFPSSTMSRPGTRNHVLLLSNSLQRLFSTYCAHVLV